MEKKNNLLVIEDIDLNKITNSMVIAPLRTVDDKEAQ